MSVLALGKHLRAPEPQCPQEITFYGMMRYACQLAAGHEGSHITLVEWPDRASAPPPPSQREIEDEPAKERRPFGRRRKNRA